jgi:alkanesulfonate monooxygenase SsuD/methylene tetrahydromethanopterin reductase-like flavin-dependent oxidoreductase (luciferase family)
MRPGSAGHEEENFTMRTQYEARPGAGAGVIPLQRSRLGLVLPASMHPRVLAALARRADEGGYDSLWIEHEPGDRTDTLSTLAYLAGRTNRIALGARLDLPAGCAHWHLLERLTSVARLADGRFILGVDHPVDLGDGSFAQLAPAQVAGVVRAPGSASGVVGATVVAACDVTYQPVEGARPAFAGAFDQLAEDVERYRRMGAYEVVLDLRQSASIGSADDYVWHIERLREAVEPGLAPRRAPGRAEDLFDSIT